MSACCRVGGWDGGYECLLLGGGWGGICVPFFLLFAPFHRDIYYNYLNLNHTLLKDCSAHEITMVKQFLETQVHIFAGS